MIYFDNAATSYPKPSVVKKAVVKAINFYGGNPGRSGHEMSLKTAEKIYETRHKLGEFFDCSPENVIFTLNCTYSLNMAIQGVLKDGDHVITSCLEHNSLSRPIYKLKDRGVDCTVVDISVDDFVTLERIKSAVTTKTKAIIMTAGSNVTGQILPIKLIGELCRNLGICYIVDGAQAGGVIPLKMSYGIDILCLPAHKSLYGITGVGVLITNGKFKISPIIQGGTGASSDELEQTNFLPESLESGTLNTAGIIALGSGIDFIENVGIEKIHSYEKTLCDYFSGCIEKIGNVILYRKSGANYLPIVPFNIKGVHSSQIAQDLSDKGFCLRGGLQCSALTHKFLGTLEQGVVRFSPSIFSTKNQVEQLVFEIAKISKKIS